MNIFRLFSVFFGCFLGFSAAISQAENLICGRCGKEITGRYLTYTFKGQTKLIVCQDCDRRLPHCKACGVPFPPGSLILHKGERLCKSCLDSAVFCNLCGKRLEGKYYQSKNGEEKYCAQCYNRNPRCSVCDRPGPVTRLSNGKCVCEKCLPTLPICGACGQPIAGNYIKYETSDKVFCETCQKTAPKCYACGVPLGKKHWLFDDGRRICDACNARSVYDLETIRQIMRDVEKICREKLDLNVQTSYDLQVKALNNDSSVQAQKAKDGENDESPLYGKELGLFRKMNGKTEIFLLYGLPAELLYDTAAHEFAHAWQAENCIAGQSPEMLEGFAQWVSAQVLRIKGYNKALEHLEDRKDNPYGTGYKKINAVAQRFNRDGFYNFVKRTRDL